MPTLFENDNYKLQEHTWGYRLTHKRDGYHTIESLFTTIMFLEDRGKGIKRYGLYWDGKMIGEIFDRELSNKLSEKLESLLDN